MTSPAPYRSTSILTSSIASGLMALGALVATNTAATAQTVGLARVGPSDPVTGYPLFYEDTNGLRLGLCKDPGSCLFEVPNPLLPVHFPAFPGDPATNFPNESFYWSGETSMTGAGATALLVLAIEAAFANEEVVPGDNVVFARVRIRITGLVDGATYVVTHPYGTETFVAGVDGPLPGTVNMTRDVGIGAAMDFGLALTGDVGPFLTPLGFASPGFPGQFLSNGNDTLVDGSPIGANFFRISGPNAHLLFPANNNGFNRARVDTFSITGQVASQLGAGVDRVTVDKTATGTAVNIWASTAAAQSLAVSVDGSPGIPMQGGAGGLYFARMLLPVGAPTPSDIAVSNLTDFPSTTFQGPDAFDTVEVLGATFQIGGDLLVSARSSDKTGGAVMTLLADGFAPTVLGSLGNGEAGGPVTIPPGVVPPKTVRVESSLGGAAVANVVIAGEGSQGTGVPLIANAGTDLTVQSGALVALNGLASSGNITGYAWSHDAGGQISLLAADTATPSFTAPIVGTNLQLDIHLSLLVFDGAGGAAVDNVVVHVLGPVGPLDVVDVLDARLSVGKGAWRVTGVNSLAQGQSVKVYVGVIGDRSRLLATVPVSLSGAWTFIGGTPAGVVLAPTDTTVWAESTLVGTPDQQLLRRL